MFADNPGWPYAEDVTADLLYLRRHGSETLYASGCSDDALERWAARIAAWAAGAAPAGAKLIDPTPHPPANAPTSMSISTTTPATTLPSTRRRCQRN